MATELGTLAHTLEEALGVREQLLGRHRDLRAPNDVLVREVEPRVGPQEQLVKRGLAVDQPDLRRGDLAAIEPDLATAQAADQRQHRAATECAQRAHERVHAGGLDQASRPGDRGARSARCAGSGRS